MLASSFRHPLGQDRSRQKRLQNPAVYEQRGAGVADECSISVHSIALLIQVIKKTRVTRHKRYGRIMEAGIGIENIFKFLRVDYVWRISYRSHEHIQKRGVRMAMSLSF